MFRAWPAACAFVANAGTHKSVDPRGVSRLACGLRCVWGCLRGFISFAVLLGLAACAWEDSCPLAAWRFLFACGLCNVGGAAPVRRGPFEFWSLVILKDSGGFVVGDEEFDSVLEEDFEAVVLAGEYVAPAEHFVHQRCFRFVVF